MMDFKYGCDSKGRWATIIGEILEAVGSFTKAGVDAAQVMLIQTTEYEGKTTIRKPQIDFYGEKAKVFTGTATIFEKGDIVEIGYKLSSNDGQGKFEGRVFGKTQGIYIRHARGENGLRLDGKAEVAGDAPQEEETISF